MAEVFFMLHIKHSFWENFLSLIVVAESSRNFASQTKWASNNDGAEQKERKYEL